MVWGLKLLLVSFCLGRWVRRRSLGIVQVYGIFVLLWCFMSLAFFHQRPSGWSWCSSHSSFVAIYLFFNFLFLRFEGLLLRCLNLWELCEWSSSAKQQTGLTGSCKVSKLRLSSSWRRLSTWGPSSQTTGESVQPNIRTSFSWFVICSIIMKRFCLVLFFCYLKQLPAWSTEQGSRCPFSLLSYWKWNCFWFCSASL